MTFVVVGVTGATLYVTGKRVRDTYQHLFEEQFQQQLRFFSESRIRQLEEITRKYKSMAQTVRVTSAMETALLEDEPDVLYDALEVELDELIKSNESGSAALRKFQDTVRKRFPNAPAPPKVKERDRVPVTQGNQLGVAVVDSDGKVLVPRKPRPSFMLPSNVANRSQKLRMFSNRAPAEAVKDQEIGYLPVKKEADGAQLRELIVTPLVNRATGDTLGALVMGFAVRDFGETAMYQFSDKTLLSGIWLDDKLYTQTIPAAVTDEVAGRVAAEIKGATAGTARDLIVVDGVPHRLFFKVLNPDSIFPAAVQVCLYSMQEAIVEQADLRAKVLGFGGMALLVGVGFIFFLSHGFSRPVEQLARATQLVRDGDFTVKVPVTSRDELGTLAASFNEMTSELALKERYKAVLAQVTDKEVAEQLISGEMSLGGEVRQVTVLFCDIRGFTSLTENMPPADVITMLNEHMTAMNRIVHEHYGVVDKFVGDLIMAVFGAPKSYGNDAVHAVKCALRMMGERRELNAVSRYQFEVGIGIATGEVVAGCMGSEDRLNYTVLGERVNLASRLCSEAASTELLIDETTYSLLPEGFLAEATMPLALKGYSAPVPAYRLTNLIEEAAALPTG